MPVQHYSNFIDISPSFESVVDLAADQRNTNLWREYIVGNDMEKLVDVLCQSLNNEAPDARRSFWVHGSYGTGKSYAAIFVKHLLEEKPEVVEQFLAQSNRLSTFRPRFMKARKKGDYLVVWKTGCTGVRDGNAMLLEAEKAIRDALEEKFGTTADYGESSLHDAVLEQLHNQAHNWKYILETSTLGNDYTSTEELLQKVETGDLLAIQRTAMEIHRRGWGLINSVETFKKWVGTIIDRNGLSKTGIFFIWDEFTEYIAHSDDHTVMQQISEFCKEKPFYMMFVVHRAHEMLASMGEDRYQKISDRFHQVEFHISADAAYDLIAGSILIRNGMDNHWKEERKRVVSNIRPQLPDLEGADDKIAELIESLCPMHPMTIKLLSRVAENFAAAQRTMFRFMKDQQTPEQGFVGYINKYGPDDQASWLTPEWLWDYFFTRASDFSDKDTKAADYIRHYEDNKYLVENSENALRIFKTAMLLMAIMSNTKGFYGGRRSQDGISATVDCLENCMAGVMSKQQVNDILGTLEENKLLVLDSAANGTVYIQMPYSVGSNVDFTARLEANEKKYTRYQMFTKDGVAAHAFEKQAWDETDASLKRMKIAVCCAETQSINMRLDEVNKEIEKAPYKIGLLIVTVRDENQAISIQTDLQNRALQSNQPRLVIALNREAFTDDKRKEWITAITKYEMATAAGATGDANGRQLDAQRIISSWVGAAINGGKMIAWSGSQVMSNIYGMAHLRKLIRINIQDKVFPFAPEMITVTTTAYKPCNEKTALAGVQREAATTQLKSVVDAIRQAGGGDLVTFEEMLALTGSSQADSIAALASCVHEEVERAGSRVVLDDLWRKLQAPPYGYYDNMVCGVLLGYVFSAFKSLGYTWTDGTQAPHVLADATINTLVLTMCKGKMTTDYLFAGSEAWRKFRDYLKYIFGLDDTQVAEEVSGCHNVREVITKTGTPFWALKYLRTETWQNQDAQDAAIKIIDSMQQFIAQESDSDNAMSGVVRLFNGRAKVKSVMAKSFQDKHVMTDAFRNFVFEKAPELQEIAEKIAVQPQDLSDKLHSVMQGAIYTWTEEQVAEKLEEIIAEYKYLDVLSTVLGTTYQSGDTAKRELANRFSYLRIPMAAIETVKKPWYPALDILCRVAQTGLSHISSEALEQEMSLLQQHGTYANDCLKDAKPILADILALKGFECTQEELDHVYEGLKGLTYNTSINQFERELQSQISRISMARNRIMLKEKWVNITSTDSVKKWCSIYKVPVLLLASQSLRRAISTVIDVQNEQATTDVSVQDAINALESEEMVSLCDEKQLDQKFLEAIGSDYKSIWNKSKDIIISKAKLELGNDMSTWASSALLTIQSMLKKEMQARARQEKLEQTKALVSSMAEQTLRSRIRSFLEQHPEFCDDFSK